MAHDALSAEQAQLPSSHDAGMPRGRGIAVVGAIVACAPLILLTFNRDWFLTRENVLDSWQYVGLFQQYFNPSYAHGAYKLARLPWILTGSLTYWLLPPLAAARVPHGLLARGSLAAP